jgi:hypothetical protein
MMDAVMNLLVESSSYVTVVFVSVWVMMLGTCQSLPLSNGNRESRSGEDRFAARAKPKKQTMNIHKKGADMRIEGFVKHGRLAKLQLYPCKPFDGQHRTLIRTARQGLV